MSERPASACPRARTAAILILNLSTMTSFDAAAPRPKRVWREGDKDTAEPERPGSTIYRPDILEVIEKRITELDTELRALSLDIHGGLQFNFTVKC